MATGRTGLAAHASRSLRSRHTPEAGPRGLRAVWDLTHFERRWGDGMGMVPMVRACLFLEVDETWEHGKTFDKTAKGC